MNVVVRLALVVALLGVVVGTGVHYDAIYEDRWPYPTSDELAAEYASHVGESTLLFGTVRAVEDGTARIEVEHTSGSFELAVRGFDAAVRPGGVVQVYGTLRPASTIDAERFVVVNPSGASDPYKYAVSLVGALLVVVAFFGYWRVDRETMSFEARSR